MTRLSICLWMMGCCFGVAHAADTAAESRIAFFVCGDPQYLAEHNATPKRLDPLSEQANSRFITLLNKLRGTTLPENMGGGRVAPEIRGLIVTGDLIDSLDKNGGHYPAMQRFEWKRFVKDYGLTGRDGRVPFPVYELHGNHDGPQGETFIIDAIIERNRKRPGVGDVSFNGLHYSWDWGPLHLVNLGIFVGEGEQRRKDHHYAPRASLEFLRADLTRRVGDSGRPVIVSHHLHLDAPEFDWPAEDLAAYHALLKRYNVVAIFNGHTHASPPRHQRWDGTRFGPKIDGIDNFDPDDAGASKLHKGKPVGLAHGLLYVEMIDRAGTDNDEMIVRSYRTRDNWASAQWDRIWRKQVTLPATVATDPIVVARKPPAPPVPDRLVVLTFDDSAVSHATQVAPLLKKHGFGATFFITEGFKFATDKKHYMTWKQIKQLHDAGFEIGNHTRHHKGVNGQTPTQIDADVSYIEQQCARHGIPRPTSFCYPGYATSDAAVKVLRARGYRFARAGGARAFDPAKDNPLLTPQAFDGKPGSTYEQFVAATAKARNGKIAVMTFHGVPDAPHPWVSTTPERFERYIKHLADEGCTVIAMRDLAKYLPATTRSGTLVPVESVARTSR